METPDIEKIKTRVRKIYQNYGIDIQSLQDEDLSDVYSFYINNPKRLEDDYAKSEKLYKSNPSVDII
jgi:hypothetical protein|tara:strand:- start:17819 stop:18019 length:201 start_codon:yes stop_codon:yes gene_type:complete